eukprot:GHVN01008133.1.p1 GENE.GHVN01008133.1~~GHVN01008133.1.p1  ORF type:complete len:1627 (-),score=209.71 GHVN01008133.1:3653-7945(-)
MRAIFMRRLGEFVLKTVHQRRGAAETCLSWFGRCTLLDKRMSLVHFMQAVCREKIAEGAWEKQIIAWAMAFIKEGIRESGEVLLDCVLTRRSRELLLLGRGDEIETCELSRWVLLGLLSVFGVCVDLGRLLELERITTEDSSGVLRHFFADKKSPSEDKQRVLRCLMEILDGSLGANEMELVFKCVVEGDEEAACLALVVVGCGKIRAGAEKIASKALLLCMCILGKDPQEENMLGEVCPSVDELVELLFSENSIVANAASKAILFSGRKEAEKTFALLAEKYMTEIRKSPAWHLRTQQQIKRRMPVVASLCLFRDAAPQTFFRFILEVLVFDPAEDIVRVGISCGARLLEEKRSELDMLFSVLEECAAKKKDTRHDVFYAKAASLLTDGRLSVCLERMFCSLACPDEAVCRISAESLSSVAQRMPEEERRRLIERLFSEAKNGTKERGWWMALGYAMACSEERERLFLRLLSATDSREERSGAVYSLRVASEQLAQSFEPFFVSAAPSMCRHLASNTDGETETELTLFFNSALEHTSSFGVEAVFDATTSLLEGTPDEKAAALNVLLWISRQPKDVFVDILPRLISLLVGCLSETNAAIKRMAAAAINGYIHAMDNPEVKGTLSMLAVDSLSGIGASAKGFLDQFTHTKFVYYPDVTALAILVPPIAHALYSCHAEVRHLACQAVVCVVFYAASSDIAPYVPQLVDGLCRNITDPLLELRETAAQGFGLVSELFPPERPALLLHFISRVKEAATASERAGAAQALASIIRHATSKEKKLLCDEIEAAMHGDDVRARDGICLLFVHAMPYLQTLFPAIERLLLFLVECFGSASPLLRDSSKKSFESFIQQAVECRSVCKTLDVLSAAVHSDIQNCRAISMHALDFLVREILLSTQALDEDMPAIAEDFLSPLGPKERASVFAFLGAEATDRLSVLFYVLKHDTLSSVKNIATAYWSFFSDRSPRELRRLFPRIVATLCSMAASPDRTGLGPVKKTAEELMRKMGVDEFLAELLSCMEACPSGVARLLSCMLCLVDAEKNRSEIKRLVCLCQKTQAYSADQAAFFELLSAAHALDSSLVHSCAECIVKAAIEGEGMEQLERLFFYSPPLATRFFLDIVEQSETADILSAINARSEKALFFVHGCLSIDQKCAAELFVVLLRHLQSATLRSQETANLVGACIDALPEAFLAEVNLLVDSQPEKAFIIIASIAETAFATKTFNKTLLFEKWLCKGIALGDVRALERLLATINFREEYPFQIIENTVKFALQQGGDTILSPLLDVCTQALFTDATLFLRHATIETALNVFCAMERVDGRLRIGFAAAILRVMNTRLDDRSRENTVKALERLLVVREDIKMFFPQITTILFHALFEWEIKDKLLHVVSELLQSMPLEESFVSFGEQRQAMMDRQGGVTRKKERSALFEAIKRRLK